MEAYQVLAVVLSLVASASVVACGKRNSYSPFMAALLPDDSDYIVGGSLAGKNEFPWQVAILTRRQFCGGSIISDSWILTAAHCITDELQQSEYLIVAGSRHVKRRESTSQIRKAAKIIVHPGWDSQYFINDIALIKLSQPLVASASSVAPVRLPESSDANRFNRKTCTASGWGAAYNDGPTSPVLLKVDLPIVSNYICNNRYFDVRDVRINENHICAGDLDIDGTGVGQGDSGGPLVCEENGAHLLAGITSFGVDCGDSKHPTVFTRVSSFRRWIDSNIA
ncbi:trypsin [Galendromus occidentalis]|uniref:Trypsin n=1 Tax=Galendromus occidentalis TaxID=34638 RepID=A0AAJ6QTY0_9ACAR|nr:trypsin [Galendromus occidentalis]